MLIILLYIFAPKYAYKRYVYKKENHVVELTFF